MFRRRRNAEDSDDRAARRPTGDDIFDEFGDDEDAAEAAGSGEQGGAERAEGTADRAPSRKERRRQRREAGSGDRVTEDVAAVRDRAPKRERPAATSGPFDIDDVDEDEHTHRIDFGALRVPVRERTEIRVEAEESTGTIRTLTVVHEQGQLQLGAYAAPRSAGIWDEVRAQIVSSLSGSGGTVDEHDGVMGPEVRATVTVKDGKRTGTQRVRFMGVDGPRWFLRGVISGPAADDDEAAKDLLDVFRSVVVVRGGDPHAPHEQLPLRMPRDAEPVEEPGPRRPEDNPFRRGPEITEIR